MHAQSAVWAHWACQLTAPYPVTQAMQGLSGQQQALDASRTALTGAVAEQRELEQGQRGAAQAVESYAQRASQLQAQLQAAKQKVDLAQVCHH